MYDMAKFVMHVVTSLVKTQRCICFCACLCVCHCLCVYACPGHTWVCVFWLPVDLCVGVFLSMHLSVCLYLCICVRWSHVGVCLLAAY